MRLMFHGNMQGSICLNFENIDIATIEDKKDFFIKGSESFINEGEFIGKKVLIKVRKQKKYRNFNLDYNLRLQRLRIESRMFRTALDHDIIVPGLYGVDLVSFSMIIEKIDGENLGYLMSNLSLNENQFLVLNIFTKFGEIVAKLHNIEIIHGDLTPLNILIDKENSMFIIDFGLAFYSNEIKDKAMDLFILFGALKIYPQQTDELFNSFLQGYKLSTDYDAVIDYFNKLMKKGRYKS